MEVPTQVGTSKSASRPTSASEKRHVVKFLDLNALFRANFRLIELRAAMGDPHHRREIPLNCPPRPHTQIRSPDGPQIGVRSARPHIATKDGCQIGVRSAPDRLQIEPKLAPTRSWTNSNRRLEAHDTCARARERKRVARCVRVRRPARRTAWRANAVNPHQVGRNRHKFGRIRSEWKRDQGKPRARSSHGPSKSPNTCG